MCDVQGVEKKKSLIKIWLQKSDYGCLAETVEILDSHLLLRLKPQYILKIELRKPLKFR